MLRRILSLVLPGLLSLPLLAAPPARVQALERGLDDDPAAVLRAERPAGPAWDAQLRRVLAAATLDDPKAIARDLPPAQDEAQRRGDADAQCLLAAAAVAHDRRTLSVEETEANVAAALADARDRPWCIARLELARGRMHTSDGRMAVGLPSMQRTISLAEADGDGALAAAALSELAWAYKRTPDGDPSLKRAIDAGEAAMRRLSPQPQRFLAATLHHNLAGVYLAAGRVGDASQQAEAALRYASAIGDTLGTAYIGRLLARIELAQGRPAQALAHYTAAREVFTASGQGDMVVVAAIGQADSLLALKRPTEAQAMLAGIDAMRRDQALPENDLLYHATAMEVHAALGDAPATAAAARAWAEALREQEAAEGRRTAAELRARFESERTEAELRRLRDTGEAARARQFWLLATLALAALLLAGLVLHLLQQRRLRERLRRLAEHDELTGLPNRRAILETARALATSRRERDHPACLAVLDIDHFKRVNDRWGHGVGDAALQAFARACGSSLRQGDRVGRMGGEEFLLVLPATRPDEAVLVFERLRQALQATAVPGMPAGERLACSMGCSVLARGGDVAEALRQADAALYRAKSEGRDRLEMAA